MVDPDGRRPPCGKRSSHSARVFSTEHALDELVPVPTGSTSVGTTTGTSTEDNGGNSGKGGGGSGDG
jgi:hypothetical protein